MIQDKNKYISLHLHKEDQQSLSHNEVKVVFEDSKGNIWLGTTGGGLNLLVREKQLENHGSSTIMQIMVWLTRLYRLYWRIMKDIYG